jgi:Peptidase C39 family
MTRARSAMTICFLVAAYVLAPSILGAQSGARPSCGVECLYIMCRMNNIHVGRDELNARLGLTSGGETSFADLSTVATDLGLHVSATFVDPAHWADLSGPAILHLKGSSGRWPDQHFIVYLGKSGRNNPVILDFPNGPEEVAAKQLQGAWSGNVMSVSRDQADVVAFERTISDAALSRRSVAGDPLLWMAAATGLAVVFAGHSIFATLRMASNGRSLTSSGARP